VMEGLALTRAVHDRYHASRRNPWNEIESGDHYARSMASYGVFLAACGLEYNGPKSHIGFAPRLTPENFKCAFTGAEGWGSFAQHVKNGEVTAEITLRSGKLRLKTVSLANAKGDGASTIRAFVDNKELRARFKNSGDRVLITFAEEVTLLPDQALRITLL
jgi:non-lysosomal glucosylceramidase